MNYTAKRVYDYNDTTSVYEMCYPLSHVGAIYTDDAETTTLQSWMADRIYKTKNSLPIADSSLSATDFASNIANLYTALGAYTDFKFFTSSSNLASSIVTKLSTDLGLTFTSTEGFQIEMTTNVNNVTPNKIFIYPNNSTRIFYISYDNTVGVARELTTQDSGWIDIPISTGLAVSGYTPQYRKIGNRVILKGRITNLNANGLFATLPLGYRPNTQRVFICAMNNSLLTKLSVDTQGGLNVYYITQAYVATDYICLDNISFVTD